MKSSWLLERELLREAWELERIARKIWIRKAILGALTYTLLNYVVFFLLFYTYHWIIFIPWLYFFESGFSFFVAYIVGYSSKPIIIWNIFSSTQQITQKSSQYNIGTHHTLRYVITGLILFILSAVTHYTWPTFFEIFIL